MSTVSIFVGDCLVATGPLRAMAAMSKKMQGEKNDLPLQIFDDNTARVVEVDFRGSVEEVLARIPESMEAPEEPTDEASRGRGRPRLGVVPREVTLLPRHWDWLNTQPGGASVALRKLVEEARRASSTKDRKRHAQEVAYRFLTTMAGNLPGFEEVIRALYAGDAKRFDTLMTNWSPGIRDYVLRLAAPAFE